VNKSNESEVNRTKSFYEDLWEREINDVIGERYGEYATKHRSTPKMTILETYIEAISVRESIFEIGCGSGRILSYFRKKYDIPTAYGSDISEKAVSFAMGHHRDCEFFVCNIDKENLPFKDSEIDIVILCDIVEHVRDYDHLLREAIRVGKHVVIKVPLERTWLEYAKTLCGRDTSINKRHNEGHIQSFTLGHFKRYFQRLEKEIVLHVEMVNVKKKFGGSKLWILNILSNVLYQTLFYKRVFSTNLGIHIEKTVQKR